MPEQEFEKNSYGCCFPRRLYYPVYLANGVDGMMINILDQATHGLKTLTTGQFFHFSTAQGGINQTAEHTQIQILFMEDDTPF